MEWNVRKVSLHAVKCAFSETCRYQSLKEARAMHAFAGCAFLIVILKLRVDFARRVQHFGRILACFATSGQNDDLRKCRQQ